MPTIIAEPTPRLAVYPPEPTVPDVSYSDALTNGFATLLANACDVPVRTSPVIASPIFMAPTADQNIAPGTPVGPSTEPQGHPADPQKVPLLAGAQSDPTVLAGTIEPGLVTDPLLLATPLEIPIRQAAANPTPSKPSPKAGAAPAKPDAPAHQPIDSPAPPPASDFLTPPPLAILLSRAPEAPASGPSGSVIAVAERAPTPSRPDPLIAAEPKPQDTAGHDALAAPAPALATQTMPSDQAIQPMLAAPNAAAAPTHASFHVTSAPPSATPPPGLTSQLGSAFVVLAREGEGLHHLTITLQPPDLGLLRISIEQAKDSPTKIAITAANPTTLLTLLRDQTALNQALDNAGIGGEGRALTFHLAAANDPLPAVPQADSTDGPRSFMFQFSSQTGPGPGPGHDGRERPQLRGQQTPWPGLNDIFPTDAVPTLRLSHPAQSGIDITA